MNEHEIARRLFKLTDNTRRRIDEAIADGRLPDGFCQGEIYNLDNVAREMAQENYTGVIYMCFDMMNSYMVDIFPMINCQEYSQHE